MIDEHEPPDLKTAWKQLDALDGDLKREESALRTSDRYLALCMKFNRCLLALIPRAREVMGGDHV